MDNTNIKAKVGAQSTPKKVNDSARRKLNRETYYQIKKSNKHINGQNHSNNPRYM